MPPARRRGARRVRATVGRRPTSASPTSASASCSTRRAARRARGRHRPRRQARLRQGRARPRRAGGRDGARRRGRARGLDAGARGQRLRALRALPGAQRRAAPALQRCFPEAAHPYDPLLDDYEPGMTTADVRDALRRLRNGLVPLVAAAPEHRRHPVAGWPVPRSRPARAAGHRAARARRRRGAVAPRRGDAPVRGDDRHDRTCA